MIEQLGLVPIDQYTKGTKQVRPNTGLHIRPDTPDELVPEQKYVISAREWIANLKAKKPEVHIEIRWCPDHPGIECNDRAD